MKKLVTVLIGTMVFLSAHTTVYFEPLRIQGNVGDQIDVQLMVKDGQYIFAWALNELTFDPSVLQGVSVTQGSYLSSRGSTLWGSGSFDNTNGTLTEIYCSLMGSVPSAWGPGTLATITFDVIGTGDFLLNITDFDISSPLADEIYPYFTLDGWYGTQTGLGNIAISTAVEHQSTPDIARSLDPDDNNKYIVVWEDRRTGTDWNIYGQRVNPDGTLDGTNFLISRTSLGSASPGDQHRPAIAYNPRNQLFQMGLVVFEDTRNTSWVNDSTQIYGHLIYNGAPTSSDDIQISSLKLAKSPRVAAKMDTFLVVYGYYTGKSLGYGDTVRVIGQFIGNMGNLIGDTLTIFKQSSSNTLPRAYPDVAYGGGKFLCVWTYYPGAPGSPPPVWIRGRIVTPQGMEPSFNIWAPNSGRGSFPRASFDGTNFLVVWTRGYFNGTDANTSILGQFVSPSGNLVGSAFTIASGAPIQNPAISFDAVENAYIVTWATQQSGYYDIYAQYVSTSGGLIGFPFVVSDARYAQVFPAVAAGNSAFVVWQDARNGNNYDIYGDGPLAIGIEEQFLTAKLKGSEISLFWSSGTPSHWEVQRKFQEKWVLLDKLPGYSREFVDKNPVKRVNTYRIIGYFSDGSTKILGPVSVNFHNYEAPFELSFLPDGKYKIIFNSQGPYQISLFDPTGRKLKNYALAQNIFYLKFNGKSPGPYFLSIRVPGFKTTKKILNYGGVR